MGFLTEAWCHVPIHENPKNHTHPSGKSLEWSSIHLFTFFTWFLGSCLLFRRSCQLQKSIIRHIFNVIQNRFQIIYLLPSRVIQCMHTEWRFFTPIKLEPYAYQNLQTRQAQTPFFERECPKISDAQNTSYLIRAIVQNRICMLFTMSVYIVVSKPLILMLTPMFLHISMKPPYKLLNFFIISTPSAKAFIYLILSCIKSDCYLSQHKHCSWWLKRHNAYLPSPLYFLSLSFSHFSLHPLNPQPSTLNLSALQFCN